MGRVHDLVDLAHDFVDRRVARLVSTWIPTTLGLVEEVPDAFQSVSYTHLTLPTILLV